MCKHKIIKKLEMRTVTGFSGRDCVLIILFRLYGPKFGLFEGNLFWVGQHDPPPPPPTFILEERLIQY